MRQLLISFILLMAASSSALAENNVFLITLDGVRWEEVFTGADEALLRDTRFTEDPEALAEAFWRDTPEARREALVPTP